MISYFTILLGTFVEGQVCKARSRTLHIATPRRDLAKRTEMLLYTTPLQNHVICCGGLNRVLLLRGVITVVPWFLFYNGTTEGIFKRFTSVCVFVCSLSQGTDTKRSLFGTLALELRDEYSSIKKQAKQGF